MTFAYDNDLLGEEAQVETPSEESESQEEEGSRETTTTTPEDPLAAYAVVRMRASSHFQTPACAS